MKIEGACHPVISVCPFKTELTGWCSDSLYQSHPPLVQYYLFINKPHSKVSESEQKATPAIKLLTTDAYNMTRVCQVTSKLKDCERLTLPPMETIWKYYLQILMGAWYKIVNN